MVLPKSQKNELSLVGSKRQKFVYLPDWLLYVFSCVFLVKALFQIITVVSTQVIKYWNVICIIVGAGKKRPSLE